jgi:hypothetical protein
MSNNFIQDRNAIIVAGLVAGTLDILAAFATYYIMTGNGPMGVLLFVASGAFGNDAFSGGLPMAMMGLLFHYIIAFSFTLLFYVIARKLKAILMHPIASGIAYGIMVWAFMNFVILPISHVNKPVFTIAGVTRGVLTIIFAVGLPIAIIISRKLKRR